jgi:hypothetical protein
METIEQETQSTENTVLNKLYVAIDGLRGKAQTLAASVEDKLTATRDMLVKVYASVEAQSSSPLELTRLYITLRDEKGTLEAAYKTQVAAINARMGRVEARLLEALNEAGADSVKTAYGTPYKSTVRTISVADGEHYNRFVLSQAVAALPLANDKKEKLVETLLASGAMSFLENRASKSAVENYIGEGNTLPPGLNASSVVKLNVRAS